MAVKDLRGLLTFGCNFKSIPAGSLFTWSALWTVGIVMYITVPVHIRHPMCQMWLCGT
jgi:hypothetical protein